MRQAFFAWMLAVPVSMPAQVTSDFSPPSAHPVERYQAGWEKNPFVLKTAPVVREQVSFARDWIIAGCFGEEDNPIVVLANTKTRERVRLKKGEPASNGMNLRSVTFTASLKDTVAEVSLGAASAVLKFDESYLKQAKGQPKSQTTPTGRQSSGTLGGDPGPGGGPVASTPRDQGSGFPYTYGAGGDGNAVVSADSANQEGGRRRMLTAQKPVGGK